MTRITASVVVLVVYLLHQDVWFWTRATPIVFGVLPIGLFYHVVYTVGVSLLLWWLVRSFWPAHLESGPPHAPDPDQAARPRQGAP
jgi:hypothetical protein